LVLHGGVWFTGSSSQASTLLFTSLIFGEEKEMASDKVNSLDENGKFCIVPDVELRVNVGIFEIVLPVVNLSGVELSLVPEMFGSLDLSRESFESINVQRIYTDKRFNKKLRLIVSKIYYVSVKRRLASIILRCANVSYDDEFESFDFIMVLLSLFVEGGDMSLLVSSLEV
jgi:hypothetical protein